MVKKQNTKADIVDVARAAKVSASTVSRSFNHPNLVNPATRKKIDRAVKKLGYIRNRAAQAMHGKRSGTIGLIVPTIDHAIFAEVVQSFSEVLEATGFTILMASHGFDLDREYQVLRKLLEHRVDGVALIGLNHTEDTFQLLEQQEIPAVAIWNYSDQSRISCVGADNHLAGQLAAQHLLALGHQDIGLIFPATDGNDRALGRMNGAVETLAAAGISVPDEWRFEAPYDIGRAKKVCLEMFQHPHRPKALLCGNDVIAQGAIFAAQSEGLNVPQDMSIIGVGDFKGSAEIEPALSTIRIPAKNIGRISGELIVDLVASGSTTPERILCDVKQIIRNSTTFS
ncbi:MAG: LacI family DNA-binding transcriptional regulator [Paracoccaceae bacterium]|nr:transcriptional regulator, LacI family protein [Rhodobacteraceae bacterium HTCC2150]MDG1532784.1 LacI family DNA-binding transcriptional regulator [Paracoccaceae bacterium]